MDIKVKICGITNLEDALFAALSGADALGFVFWEKSPRRMDPDSVRKITEKLPPFVTAVGVFVNETTDKINDTVRRAGITCAQLHGDETPEVCSEVEAKVIKAVRVRTKNDIESLSRYGASAFLLDTYREGTPGGTGESFDWGLARGAKKYGRVILAGGLTPENVLDAIKTAQPYAVDVSSGVELEPGKKDHLKVLRFIKEAKKISEEMTKG